jgi:hypothetical protein
MSSPEVLEPAGRQLGVSHRVLDIAVAEVSLQRSGIVALVGQLLCVFENEWVARPFPRREGIPTDKRL